MYLSDKQIELIEIFFHLANKNPNQKMSIKVLASHFGMTRESVHRYYISNMDELFEKIHYLVDHEISEAFENFFVNNDTHILEFITSTVLPLLYKQKDKLKILYGINVDPNWMNFLENKYTPLIENYLDQINIKSHLPNSALSKIVVIQFTAIVSIWLTSDYPEPVALFQEKFMELFHQSSADILTKRKII